MSEHITHSKGLIPSAPEERVIWKYPVSLLGAAEGMMLKLPKGAMILNTAYQQSTDSFCFWAAVDPHAPLVERKFKVLATGQPFNVESMKDMEYYGSFFTDGGKYVFHFVEVVEYSRA